MFVGVRIFYARRSQLENMNIAASLLRYIGYTPSAFLYFEAQRPGDALRLVHSIRMGIELKILTPLVCVMIPGPEHLRMQGLVSDSRQLLFSNSAWAVWREAFVIWVVFHQRNYLGRNFRKARRVLKKFQRIGFRFNSPVYHVFLDGTPLDFREHRISGNWHKRFDTSAVMSRGTFSNQLPPFKFVSRHRPQLLYFERTHSQDRWRNTPAQLTKDMIEYCQKKNIDMYHSGIRDESKHGLKSVSFGSLSYTEQIRLYRNYDLAVGTNCAAMDLATAAGLPTIRLCEFQRLKPNAWGAGYNRYLSLSRVVGIEPRSKNTGWYTEEFKSEMFKAIDEYILAWKEHPNRLLIPSHEIKCTDSV
jgi:hypothetical protein